MKSINKYINEHISGVEEKGDLYILKTFKPNMIKSSQLVDVIKEFNNSGKYDTIIFDEFISGQTENIRYLYSDNDVFTFEKFSDKTKKYVENNLKTFLKDLKHCNNGIAQFALTILEGDLTISVFPDSNNKSYLTIVFSKEEINQEK